MSIRLLEAVTILSEEGLDMSDLEVKSLRFPGSAPGRCYWDYYDPTEFLRSGGMAQTKREDVGPAV